MAAAFVGAGYGERSAAPNLVGVYREHCAKSAKGGIEVAQGRA